MPHLNGHSPNLVTLSLKDDDQFIKLIHSHLDSSNYHIRLAKTIDEANQLLKVYTPKAIIATGDCDIISSFFKTIRNHYTNYDCPVLVLISETGAPESGADITLPPAWLQHIHAEINSFILRRTEHNDLVHNQLKLIEENNRLKSKLHNHEKSSDDMNFLKNAIVWNVAHELRTPLLQVKSAVALLAEDVGNNTVLVELAMGATTRLETVVKDITLLNELVNESMESRSFEPVLMREVVDSAFRNLRRSWQHKNDVDRIVTHIPPHLPPAFGDKQRLVIALQLLMDNALKFSKGTVEVIMESTQGKIRTTVRDKGIGIPKDKVEKVFDTFYQVDSSTTKRYGGMGIGLAIVRFILDRHQAEITVETEEGKGSSFTFELAVVEVRAS